MKRRVGAAYPHLTPLFAPSRFRDLKRRIILDKRAERLRASPENRMSDASILKIEGLEAKVADEDLIFKDDSVRAFQSLLKAADLYEDGDGNTRNRKALRATGISFRILEGANVTLIANNSGTSINSISNFYAKHLRGTDDIDALTSITRLPKRPRRSP